MATHIVDPKPAPDLKIPPSSSAVVVRVIDSTTLRINPKLFWQPQLKGLLEVYSPDYCFLVSNGNRHVLFDLAVRRDWENYAPATVSLIKNTTSVKVDKNVAEILDDDPSDLGVRASDIEAVIWSHHHFDHIGDPSTFPSSTELVVGPGVLQTYFPGFPTNPESNVLDADLAGRNVREIEFDGGIKIGRFDAMDYFGDGSFYLLDAPGHAIGHICGLARTTTSPDSFVFMGADACHHAGLIRPTEYLPLPKEISPSPVVKFQPGVCPGSMLQAIHPNHSATQPFFGPSTFLFPQHEQATETIRKIAELDASEAVFVIIAHDESLKGLIETFPQPINDWQTKGLRSSTRWLFCKDFEGAFENDDLAR